MGRLPKQTTSKQFTSSSILRAFRNILREKQIKYSETFIPGSGKAIKAGAFVIWFDLFVNDGTDCVYLPYVGCGWNINGRGVSRSFPLLQMDETFAKILKHHRETFKAGLPLVEKRTRKSYKIFPEALRA